MVIGFKDGSLKQFTPELVEKKNIVACPLLEAGSQCQITDVAWLSTYKFAVSYALRYDSDALPQDSDQSL